MRRLRSHLLVLAFAAAAASAASAGYAADLPVAPAYRPPVYTQANYDWTGVYIGGHVGGGLLEDNASPTTTTAGSATTAAFQNAGTDTRLSPSSFLAGGQIGANWEMAPFVVGVEGTWTWTNITGFQVTPALAAGPGTSEGSTDAVRWYATATGRIGYAFNDVLLYAKGGGAFMHADYGQQVLNPNMSSSQDVTDTRVGFTVGAGVEWGITEQLSLRAEYDFLDFGTKTYNFDNLVVTTNVLGLVTTVPVGPFPVESRSYLHVFTVGLNYRFNWGGGGAVAARY
jgi:outer membrane immunogenic protein